MEGKIGDDGSLIDSPEYKAAAPHTLNVPIERDLT